jgi:hypothetical protein
MSRAPASELETAWSEARPVDVDRRAAPVAVAYLRCGLRLVRMQPGLYLLATLVYMSPALAAAALMLPMSDPDPLRGVASEALPWLTAVLGTLVVMILIGRHARGARIGLLAASIIALTWVPRYVWTNAHTSLIFWGPMSLLLTARAWQEAVWPVAGGPVVTGLWWAAIALTALYLHTRTLLAPFLAIHADLPATLATLEAWRLSGRRLGLCLSTFVLASLPVALPLAGLALGAARLLPGALAMAEMAAAALVWAAIQVVRPVLMPAVYLLYKDLWSAEEARRARLGAPPTPAPLRGLLRLTWPLPKIGQPW